jgi:hypothetical protein
VEGVTIRRALHYRKFAPKKFGSSFLVTTTVAAKKEHYNKPKEKQ